MNIDPTETRIIRLEDRVKYFDQLSKEIFERIRELEKVNVIDLGIDSLLCPIMKARGISPATDSLHRSPLLGVDARPVLQKASI